MRAAVALLPVLLGGGAPLAGWVNPFWQMLFGSGVLVLTYLLPAPAHDAQWNPFAVALVPWLFAALIFWLAGRVARLPRTTRRLSLLAYASSFVMIVPAEMLEARWPEVAQLPLYTLLIDARSTPR